MKHLLTVHSLLVATVLAGQVRWPARLPRSDAIFSNSTAQLTSSILSTSSVELSSGGTPTASSIADQHQSISTSTSSHGSNTDLVSSADETFKSNHKTAVQSTSYTLPTGNTSLACIPGSTVTYVGSVYPTVYVTVTGSYEVPVTASNVSLSQAPTIFETPGDACDSTVVPNTATTTADASQTQNGRPLPDAPTVGVSTSAANPQIHRLSSTSTVVITKKTPVPVVQVPTSTGPPVNFGSGDTPAAQSTLPPAEKNPVNPQPSSIKAGNGNDSGSGGTSSSGITGPGTTSPTPSSVPGGDGVSSKLGQIIDSIINSPFAPPATTNPPAIMTPAVATIAGVAVTVNSPNVIIGGTVVTIPTATQSEATAVIDGQTFTVRASEIIAPSTTYNLIPASDANFVNVAASATMTQATSTITANGVIITVGPTQAVISGTTYAIGSGSSPTTVTVNGQTISLGDKGIVLPSTTYAPAATVVAGKYELVVVSGLTLSVDATEAVLSGTTYKIGSGAPTTTAVIGGKTVTMGPSGVVLASTTVQPTSILATGTISASTGSNSNEKNGASPTANTARLQSSATLMTIPKSIFHILALLPMIGMFI